MSDNLIDRPGAIEHAVAFWKDNDGDSAMQMIIDYLRTVPARDAVEIIRCRECIHLQKNGQCDKTSLWIGNKEDGGSDDFFCGYGERKTE